MSVTIKLPVLQFDQNINVYDPKIDLEGQGHRSSGPKMSFQVSLTILQAIFEVKVTWVKVMGQKYNLRSHLTVSQVMFEVKADESGSKVMWVRVMNE